MISAAVTTRKGINVSGIGIGLGHRQVGDIRLRGRTPCPLLNIASLAKDDE